MIRSQRSFRWGLLLPHLENSEYAQLVETLDAEAHRQGTNFVLGLTHYDAKVESSFLRHWAAGEADGVICDAVSWTENGDLYRQLVDRGYPFMALYYAPDGYSQARRDDYESFCIGLRNLIGMGHRRIAYVGVDHPQAKFTNSFCAYKEVLKSHKIEYDESLVIMNANNRESGVKAWQLIREMSNAPTAVMAFNDTLASGIWIGVHADGLSVPKDLSIIGSDDIPESRLMGLTTIRYDRAELARRVLNTLEKMRIEPMGPQIVTMDTYVVMGNSVSPPRNQSKNGNRKNRNN
nr:substrate-binding domain-containing protein [Cerasicoccus arenae]